MEFSGNLFFAGAAASVVRVPPRAHRRAAAECIPPGASAEAEAFLAWLLARVGLPMSRYRLLPLLRRLPACLRLLRAASIEDARRRLDRHPELVSAAVDAVLLGVTQFFRDEAVFRSLRDHVLPDLLGRAARIRVWSAACSEGPELYSVAMLLEEAGRLPRAELLGTDCRPEAIERARQGVFSAGALPRGGDCGWHEQFVAVGPSRIQLTERLRAATRWRQANLLDGPAPGPWDLILCRNVAIYLEPDAVRQLWTNLARELRPGGYLVTGRADRPPSTLGLIRTSPCVYHRREEIHGK